MKVMAGIVTFNPDMERLKENLEAVLAESVDHLLIFDNNSENIDAIRRIAEQKQIKLYENKTNAGIASALHYIMEYAISKQFDWVLTLDQDSVLLPGLVDQYRKYAVQLKDAAMLTCSIQDRNFSDDTMQTDNVHEIIRCITSAAFTSVPCYSQTTGYDESMFIDYVDFDMCYTLEEAGFKIYQIPFIGLLHEVGSGRNVSFLGKQYIVYNHSAFRKYYLVRNSIYCAKKHPQFDSLFKTKLRVWREMLFVLLYENNKREKLYRMCKGYFDGVYMKKN